jgi:hypothetical protein
MSDSKNNNSQNIDNTGSSQFEEEFRKDSELAEVKEELELSPEDLDEIAGGRTNQMMYGSPPRTEI